MEKYTTAELKAANPITEKGKVVISSDAFAISDMIDTLIDRINRIVGKLL